MMIDSCSYAPFGAVVRSSYNVSSICDFLEEIARHKLFSAHFLRKSATHLLTHFLRKSLGWASTHFLEEIAGMAYIELDVITTSDYCAEGT